MSKTYCRLAAALVICAMVLASCGCFESDGEPGPPRSMRVLSFDADDATSKVTISFVLLDVDHERTRQQGTLKVTITDSDEWYMLQDVSFDVSPTGIRPSSNDVYTLAVDYPAVGEDPSPTTALRRSHDRGYGDGERLMGAELTFEWGGANPLSVSTDDITIPDGLLYSNEAPHALLTAPSSAVIRTDVTFDGSASWDLESLFEDLRFKWEWAAGASAQIGQPIETHAFPRGTGPMPWMYLVTMTVMDDEDAEGVWVFNITVMDTLNVTVVDWGYNSSAEHSEETWVQFNIHNFGAADVTVQPMASELVSDSGSIELEISHEVVGSPTAQLPQVLASQASMDVICYYDCDLSFGAEKVRYWNGLELDLE